MPISLVMRGMLAAIVSTLVLFGCDTPLGAVDVPDSVAIPTSIGVMREVVFPRTGASITLEDGETVEIAHGASELTGPLNEGALLIAGHGGPADKQGAGWYASVPARSPDCYFVSVNGEVRGDRLALSLGFSVPLSARWDETETRFVESPSVGFCLDEEGRAVRPYRYQPS